MSDIKESIAKAREALRNKREKKAKFIKNSIDNLSVEPPDPVVQEIHDFIIKLLLHIKDLTYLLGKFTNIFTGYFGNADDSTGRVIFDILQIYIMEEATNKFEEFGDLYKMCLEVYDSSKESYEILRKYIPILPSCKEIEEYRKTFFTDFQQDLLNIDNLPEIITCYKTENNISSKNKLYASLAVDALFFKPDVKIKANGKTSGFLNNNPITKRQFNSFSKDIESFAKFIQENWNNIIRAGFVFQLNPLKNNCNSIVLHIIPHSNGKANSNIIETLYKIKSILRNYRIEIVCFSFDGDSSFRVLNQIFF